MLYTNTFYAGIRASRPAIVEWGSELSGATHIIASPHTTASLEQWEPTISDLKQYRHFDAPISVDKLKTLVRSPTNVLGHSFLPLLHFEKTWRRAPKNGKSRTPKIRPIRYACRKDAYIYKHYREKLAARYEEKLLEANLQDCVLAYRRIPNNKGSGTHKTNIEFARDAFGMIDGLGKCAAVAIDISDFFGSISHDHIKRTWQMLLDKDHLPDDHYRVFQSVVQYRFVCRDSAYEALGYSVRDKDGKLRYAVDPKDIPIQICTMPRFRKVIVEGGLVQKHKDDHGIPQGLPISDLLANSYLLDFDKEMKAYAETRGGYYMRYSDDILFIIPGDGRAAKGASTFAANRISHYGAHLKINADKTEIACFTGTKDSKRCYNLKAIDGTSVRARLNSNEGLSYLGFRYDGRSVFLRSGTVSNLKGKIARTARASAHAHVSRYYGKKLKWLLENAPVAEFKQQFLHVADYDEAVEKAELAGESPFKIMTFWSYAVRAGRAFSGWDCRVFLQLRGLHKSIPHKLEKEIIASYQTRELRRLYAERA